MNINSNGYVLGFAVGICVAMSAMLALTSAALKPTQLAAEEFDRQKNVMIAADLVLPDDPRPRPELEKLYTERIEEKVLELESGKFAAMTPKEYAKLKGSEQERYSVIAVAKDDKGHPEAYVLPISGKGLWSIIYGYIALDPDGNHVKGITFYKHGETPGLGGEVENPEWTAKWKGKTILDDSGKLVSIAVKKGQVDPGLPVEKNHMVDGLSGATITSRGVTTFLAKDLQAYRPYLSTIWAKN